MLEQFLIPVLVPFFTALITWIFARRKNRQVVKSMELDNEIKSAKYYKDLLDNAYERLDKAIKELMESEDRHRKLMAINRQLVEELQKFKQLNGKNR